MTIEQSFCDSVLSNELPITPTPTLNILLIDSSEKTSDGSQWLVIHKISDLTEASVIVCHTTAHAPKSLSARYMPTTELMISPMKLDMAIMRTVICFISLLVCTMAVALMMKARNMTLDRSIRRMSLNSIAINGAASHRIA